MKQLLWLWKKGNPAGQDRKGFRLEPRRWKAEQTFGCRRLRVNGEMSCASSRGMALLAALFMTGMRLERFIGS